MRGTGGGFLSLQYASARLRDDRALASEAIQSYVVKHAHGLEMGFDKMSTRLKTDRALFMEALAKYDDLQNPPSFASHFLHAADVSLRDDKELVLEVVRRDACGIEIASERLRDDRDVVLLAVCSSGDLLEFASEALGPGRRPRGRPECRVLSLFCRRGTAGRLRHRARRVHKRGRRARTRFSAAPQ